MTEKRLHIVSFDVPLPANYGGAIDVFYRIKALHQLGVKITLHCFEYGRGESKELEKYTEKVHYYKRKKKLLDVVSPLPFIVKTRVSKSLARNLLLDDAPILFEGLHTTYLLNDKRFQGRFKIVRTHNIEHEYYLGLSHQSKGLKKKFFISEVKKLKIFEKQLAFADSILAIKEEEAKHFMQYCKNTKLLPACSNVETNYNTDTESYCLFHGNLSVSENENGLFWLIDNVFLPYNLTKSLKVAGKDPSDEITEKCEQNAIELIQDPDNEEMDDLINRARVHVFYTDQDSGIKLKIIHALRTSGAILANTQMLKGAPFENLCDEVNSGDEYAKLIENYMLKPVPEIYLELRRAFLSDQLDPFKNCRIIEEMI